MPTPIAYQGAELIDFTVNLLPPLSRIYVFVNDIDITFTCTPASGIIGQPLVTDNAGSLTGKILLPASGIYKFPAGDVNIVFCENSAGPAKSSFKAEVKFFNGMTSSSTSSTVNSGAVTTVPPTTVTSSQTSGTVSTTSVDSVLIQGNQGTYPLTQTFLIDPNKYPFGIVITSLELCILEKDSELPIGIEFKTMKNGVPDTTNFITGTSVFKTPAEITTGSASNPIKTKFVIKPTYFLPGEYAFSIITNSSKYKLATAKLGSKDSSGKTITNQPYTGTLYRIQTGGIWEGDQNEDLFFVINKAKYQTGIKTFELHSPPIIGYTTDSVTFKTKDIAVGENAKISYKVKVKNSDGTYTALTSITPDMIHKFKDDYVFKNKSDSVVEVTFDNKSPDITPMVDLNLTRLLSNKHLSFAWEQDISDSELDSTNLGAARARYLSRVVTLLSGFDSTGLEVKLDVNRMVGSDIEVLCRVLSSDDNGTDIDITNQPFKRMSLVSPIVKSYAGNSENSFTTEIYKILEPDLAYTRQVSIGGVPSQKEFNNFNKFQIKVVFYSSIPGLVPKIKNLIATSVL